MAAVPNVPRPNRSTGGFTSDPPYGPWAEIGVPNPFFYHVDKEDFDFVSTTQWTLTNASTGSIAAAAGDGGLALFTTAATNNDSEVMQRPVASWTLPQGALAGKKLGFLCRLKLSDVTKSGLYAGLINATTTPFTGGQVTDGVYFNKPSGATTLNIVSNIGGTATTVAIPTAANTLANAAFIDLGFAITRKGDVLAYVGSQLVGWIPQSGTGALAGGYTVLPVAGPVARITAPSLSTANLTLMVALQAGEAVAKTLTLDFVGAAKER